MKGWLLAVVSIVAALGIGGVIGWSKLEKEHREIQGLTLNSVDFSKLKDGVHNGFYMGGIYKWRTNECEVVVEGGKVTEIRLLYSKEFEEENTDIRTLYERVVGAQSLQVDSISGATLTSKAHLQAVENALIPTQNE